jgi:excisionase family DNA binding protein
MSGQEPIQRRWYTCAEVGIMLGVSRDYVEQLTESGHLRSVMFGGKRRILPEHVEELVARIVREQEQG